MAQIKSFAAIAAMTWRVGLICLMHEMFIIASKINKTKHYELAFSFALVVSHVQ